MKAKLIHWLTLGLACIAAILAIADKVTALPVPPEWTKYWGLVVTAAIAARPVIMIIGDLLDDGQVNNSWKP